MMSRITLHLKKMGQSPYDGEEFTFEVAFSQNVIFFDATTRTRHPSTSDYFTSGADAGVSFSSPAPLSRLSTIHSQQSGEETPLEGISPSSDTRETAQFWNKPVLEKPERNKGESSKHSWH